MSMKHEYQNTKFFNAYKMFCKEDFLDSQLLVSGKNKCYIKESKYYSNFLISETFVCYMGLGHVIMT